MKNRKQLTIMLICVAALVSSCASRKVFSTNYYNEHEKTLIAIEQLYKNINQQRHFSVEFTDKSFEYISLEIITDSIKYIYQFNTSEPRLQDTLTKYQLPVEGVMSLINQMSAIHCIWINNLDYYVNNQKRSLIFMSIRHVAIRLPFTSEKYYILTFYSQPQYFDSEGRLLASRQVRKLRKINDDVFRRVNDKVAYTISERFR
ncbi:hypothetical protein GWC95_06645 [Sediminibacterium roseum]|uniref:Lipoprotein n=1 Tax=Sediminibacterium roseum TaxID=1978412 RepID=A0ABW9ZR57_9BACT|nr:hypothetical protein [Sediminibacterium roseum]NCI49592.1 hypothetical protein [Sediminibacterium roseum]